MLAPSKEPQEVRYRIEYLTESTEEDSVCGVKYPDNPGDLEAAAVFARSHIVSAKRLGATGFQIREQTDAGTIVALEEFVE